MPVDLAELLRRVQARQAGRTASAVPEAVQAPTPAPDTAPSPGAAEDEAGPLTRFWRMINKPLVPQIEQAGQGISDAITSHTSDESMLGSALRGFAGGAAEGVGRVVGGLTSPLGLATSGAGGAAFRAIRNLARGAEAAGAGADAGESLLPMINGERQFSTAVPRPRPQPEMNAPGGDVGMAGEPISRREQVMGIDPQRLIPGGRHWAGEPTRAQSDLPLAGASEQPSLFDTPAPATAAAVPAAPPPDSGNSNRLAALYKMLNTEPGTPSPRRFVSESAAPGPVGAGMSGEPPTTTVSDIQKLMSAVPREEPVPAVGSAGNATVDKVRALYDRLLPKWQKGNASAPDVPFDVPPEPFPDFYQRVLSDDPRALMGPERAVRNSIADDLQMKKLASSGGAASDEAGFVDPAALGAGVRALAPQAERLRYFSMLSSPVTHGVNAAGNVGAVGAKAAEEALTGNVSGAGKILREFFSPETFRDVRTAWRNPEEGRWGSNTGVLGMPGRAMGAVDKGTKEALRRAGISEDDAALITYTNQPKSVAGQSLVKGFNNSGLGRLFVPFSRTATNIVERGLERTPGVGSLPWVKDMTNATPGQQLARQAIGGGTMYSGYKLAQDSEKAKARGESSPVDNRVVQALLGPYALPVSMAVAAERKNAQRGEQTPWDQVKAGYDTLIRSTPVTSESYQFDPRSILASFVPNMLSKLSPTDPKSLDTSKTPPGLQPFGPAIAKIPMLNELLLKRKRRQTRQGR